MCVSHSCTIVSRATCLKRITAINFYLCFKLYHIGSLNLKELGLKSPWGPWKRDVSEGVGTLLIFSVIFFQLKNFFLTFNKLMIHQFIKNRICWCVSRESNITSTTFVLHFVWQWWFFSTSRLIDFHMTFETNNLPADSTVSHSPSKIIVEAKYWLACMGIFFIWNGSSIVGKSNVPPRSHTNASSGSTTSDYHPIFFSRVTKSRVCFSVFRWSLISVWFILQP